MVNHLTLKVESERKREKEWEWERAHKFEIAVMSKTLNKVEHIRRQLKNQPAE